MTGLQSLEARIALGVTATVAGVFVPLWRRLYAGDAARFDRQLTAVFAASRLLLFCLIFLVLHIAPRGDLIGYYMQEAHGVMAGLRPYADFKSSYAPLHAYMDAMFLHGVDSPLTLIVFVIAVECGAFFVWLRVARAVFPDAVVRCAGLLYLVSPFSLQLVTIDGQDNVVIAFLLGLAVWLAIRRREAASGMSVAASICTLKFLPLLYVPVFWLTLQRRWRWLAGCALVLVAVYGSFAWKGFHLLGPLREGALKTAGGLPYLLETIGNFQRSTLWDGLLLLSVGGIMAMVFYASRRVQGSDLLQTRLLVWGIAAITLVLLALPKKTWPNYMLMALFPVCLLIALRPSMKRLLVFAGFNLVADVEHPYYQTIADAANSTRLHGLLMQGSGMGFGLFLLEVFLITGYGWLLWLALRGINDPADAGSLPGFQGK